MATNIIYRTPRDLPSIIPIFPLDGTLLLPRVPMPLNIFEPRYITMIDDAFKGSRLIGLVQPDETKRGPVSNPYLYSTGCAGRITQISEAGDSRYLIMLLGIARFRIVEEVAVSEPYRQCRVDFHLFSQDLLPNQGEEAVDREALLHTLSNYLSKNKIEADWKGIKQTPTEALVNGLSMMAPYGTKEKQALLEAPDLKTRAELLIAVTEIALAKSNGSDLPIQ